MMEKEDVVVLDVRRPDETAAGMIEGAIEINVLDENFAQKVNELDKEKTYLVYCKSGKRSAKACNIMAENEFKNLYQLKGGYLVWSEVMKE